MLDKAYIKNYTEKGVSILNIVIDGKYYKYFVNVTKDGRLYLSEVKDNNEKR